MSFDLQNVLPLVHRGKVRETYAFPGREDLLLVITSDRISTHNVVHKSIIPHKGEVLTALTLFWLTQGPLSHLPHHIIASGSEIYDYVPSVKPSRALTSRAFIVRKLDMVSVEFIYRSYLTGSLLSAYRKVLDPYGIKLPKGLVEMSRFPHGVAFTPTKKSKNDPPRKTYNTIGQFPMEVLLGMQAYMLVSTFLEDRGVTLVDSKMEMGYRSGELFLADELFTPDSSRFVNTEDVCEGKTAPWLDKQIARDEAERVWQGKSGKPLRFSEETISRVSEKYDQLLERITGMSLDTWKRKKRFDYCV